jgi:hypothetical protein
MTNLKKEAGSRSKRMANKIQAPREQIQQHPAARRDTRHATLSTYHRHSPPLIPSETPEPDENAKTPHACTMSKIIIWKYLKKTEKQLTTG